MRVVIGVINKINQWVGEKAHWLATVLVAMITLEVTLRYVFGRPTNWNFESSMMVGGVLYALAWSYCHLKGGHIRVDVLYIKLPPRGRAVIDIISALIFFFPLIILLTLTSFDWSVDAWIKDERSAQTGWYPVMWPFRGIVTIGFLLLALQGVSNLIRDLILAVKGKES